MSRGGRSSVGVTVLFFSKGLCRLLALRNNFAIGGRDRSRSRSSPLMLVRLYSRARRTGTRMRVGGVGDCDSLRGLCTGRSTIRSRSRGSSSRRGGGREGRSSSGARGGRRTARSSSSFSCSWRRSNGRQTGALTQRRWLTQRFAHTCRLHLRVASAAHRSLQSLKRAHSIDIRLRRVCGQHALHLRRRGLESMAGRRS